MKYRNPFLSILQILILIAIQLFLYSCNNTGEQHQTTRPTARFSPQAGKSITLLRTDEPGTQIKNTVVFPPLRKQLPESVNVFNVLQADLNNDQFEEQIIAFKKKNERDNRISILVYSSDIRYEDVLFEWQAITNASELRSFVIQFENIDIDRNLEIICSGIDTKGHHTIDVFKLYTNPEQVGVSYYPVLSLVSPLGIDLKRNADDTNTQTLMSFVHYALNDAENAHPLDRIETTYDWNQNSNSYIISKTNYINGELQEQLDHGLLAAYSTQSLMSILSGLWQSDTDQILFYDLHKNSIVLSGKEIQSWYTIVTAYKTIRNTYPSVRLTMSNDLLFTVQSNLYISFIDANIIEVFSDLETESNGRYLRLEESSEYNDLLYEVLDQPINRTTLAGIYKNANGDELYLDESSFILTHNGNINQGNYVIYKLSRPILELSYMDSKTNTLIGRKFALLVSREKQSISSIELIPVQLSVRGVSFIGEQPILLDRQD